MVRLTGVVSQVKGHASLNLGRDIWLNIKKVVAQDINRKVGNGARVSHLMAF